MRCALLTASGQWLACGWGCPAGWVGMQSSENFLNQRYLLAIFEKDGAVSSSRLKELVNFGSLRHKHRLVV